MAYKPFTSRVTEDYTLSNLQHTTQTMQARQDAEAQQFDKVLERINNFNFAPEENAYRAKLVNDIMAVRNSFKEQNNGYLGANLNDIISAETKILTNPVIKAKEKYNADRDNFMKQLSASGLDPEMIQMYKEDPANGYNFKTEYDSNGNEIGGNTFEGKQWAKPVDRFALFSKVLSGIRAKSSNIHDVYFLTADGRPTKDINQSGFGAEVFKTVNGKSQRVDDKMISDAIKDAIANTPGANASFEQDYNFARWKYNKNVQENGGKPYVDENITDINGNVIGSYEQWINDKVVNFAKQRAWSESDIKTDYGSAYTQYSAQQQSFVPGNGGVDGMYNPSEINGDGFLNRSAAGGPYVYVEKNDYNELVGIRNKANNDGFSLLKNHGFNVPKGATSLNGFWYSNSKYHIDGISGPGQLYNYLVKTANDNGRAFSDEEKIQLRNNIFDSYHTMKALTNAKKNLNEGDSDALKFNNSVQTGTYKAGNSKYDDKIIDLTNLVFDGAKGHEYVDFFVSNKMINNLAAQYGSKYDFTSFGNALGADISQYDDDYVRIRINANSNCDLAKFSSNLEKADSITGPSLNAVKNLFTGDQLNDYYIRYANGDRMSGLGNALSGNIRELRKTYDKGLKKAAEIEYKIGANSNYVQMNTFGHDTFASWYLDDAIKNGMKITDANKQKANSSEYVDRQFASPSLYNMYIAEIKDGFVDTNSLINSDDARILIQKMYNDPTFIKQVSRNITDGQGVKLGKGGNPPTGYIVSFTVPKGAATGSYKEGDSVRFFISDGGATESYAQRFQRRTEAKAQSIENIAYNTNSVADPIEYHNALGLCNVDYSKGRPVINFLNHQISTNRENANIFIDHMMRLEGYKMEAYRNPSSAAYILPQIDAISNTFSNITGLSKESIAKRLMYYITYEAQ